MKLYLRIIIFLLINFALLSSLFFVTSLYSLKSSQNDNLVSFRNEFVELSRELFQKSATIFFSYLDNDIQDGQLKTRADAINFFHVIDPSGTNVVLIDIQNKTFLDGYGDSQMAKILDQKTINSFSDQWLLNQKNDYEVDNYSEFLSGKSSLAPAQIDLKFYQPIGLIVGYGKVFETAKVRIDFIEKKNQQYFDSFVVITTTIFFCIALIISLVSIFFMKRTIINPLVKLKQATVDIGKGNLSAKITVKTNDEIGELAASFNLMAKKLFDSRRNVDEKVKEISVEHGKLSSLVESVKLGVVMVDLSLNVILANSAAKKILGKTDKDNIFFGDLSEKIKDSIDISQALSFYVKSGKPLNVQEAVIDNKYYRLFMSPVRDIVEKIFIGAVVVMEDITEEKKLDKMRTEIVSITSHQLRTPATIIKGNLEMVLGGDVGEISAGQKELLDDTYMGNERMIRLINDLMDVAKIDEGKFKVVMESAQLEDLVADVIKAISPLAVEKKVILTYDYPVDKLQPVKINRQRVSQVIQNLVDNAIKYSSVGDKGAVKVDIEEGAKELEFIVSDNGIGIPEAEQEKMFERFSRGSNSTKLDPGGGSGLGLYIAKAVVEQGGGRIWFESKEGQGTKFHATFPYNSEL